MSENFKFERGYIPCPHSGQKCGTLDCVDGCVIDDGSSTIKAKESVVEPPNPYVALYAEQSARIETETRKQNRVGFVK